jgi:glycine cleavage system H protein
VNEALATAPEQVNKDAHGAWMVKIKVKDAAELNALLSAPDYDKFVSEEAGH